MDEWEKDARRDVEIEDLDALVPQDYLLMLPAPLIDSFTALTRWRELSLMRSLGAGRCVIIVTHDSDN